MRIETVDAADEQAFAAFHRVMSEANREGRPYATPWALEESRVWFANSGTESRWEAAVAYDDGESSDGPLGGVSTEWPLLDNRHAVFVEVGVRPGRWRQGIGSALLRHAVDRAREEGRRALMAFVPEAYDDPQSSPGVGFALRGGFTERLRDIHQVLDLPVDDRRLDELCARAAPHHQSYRLVSFTGACPDEYVESYCRALSVMGTEAPTGELELEAEHWDETRLRETEERRVAMGRRSYTTLALASDGEVAGYTQLGVPGHDPGNVFQWDTLVLPAHRGRRLGLAVKAATLRALQAENPGARTLHTWNAEVNAPMLAVNAMLGFRAVEFVGEWQRDLEPVDSR